MNDLVAVALLAAAGFCLWRMIALRREATRRSKANDAWQRRHAPWLDKHDGC